MRDRQLLITVPAAVWREDLQVESIVFRDADGCRAVVTPTAAQLHRPSFFEDALGGEIEPDWEVVRCIVGEEERDRRRAAWQAEQRARRNDRGVRAVTGEIGVYRSA